MKDTKKEISNFKYDFIVDLRIVVKYYYGEITIADIISSWEFAFANNLIPDNNRGFILDYRKATFNISLFDYEQIPKFYKENLHFFQDCKIAILTEKSKDIVIPVLVKEEDEGYQSAPFTTMEAAIKWVLE
jgi:hypothetical protein